MKRNIRLTDAQKAMLRAIDDYADEGSGWAEVELHFLYARPQPRFLEMAICKSIGDALIRKGLIVDADGPRLTDAGREALI